MQSLVWTPYTKCLTYYTISLQLFVWRLLVNTSAIVSNIWNTTDWNYVETNHEGILYNMCLDLHSNNKGTSKYLHLPYSTCLSCLSYLPCLSCLSCLSILPCSYLLSRLCWLPHLPCLSCLLMLVNHTCLVGPFLTMCPVWGVARWPFLPLIVGLIVL